MSLSGPDTGRRPVCPRCTRPETTCICSCIRPALTDIDLVILQHPLEVSSAKGSARLLHMCIAGSRLVPGERFDPVELAGLLHGGDRTPVLLYPDTSEARSLGIPVPPALPEAVLSQPGRLRLVVLDGTWRKSRKMLYLNPALQLLPRLPLRAMPPSHYRIRKAHAPDQLSTLEASCYALAQIEGSDDKFQPVLAAFEDFVEALAKYQRNLNPIGATPREP